MRKTAFLLWLPLAVSVLWTGSLIYERSRGVLTEVGVEGFDPRDLLAGRYLRIRTNYEVECSEKLLPAYICLSAPRKTVTKAPNGCSVFVKGRCYIKGGRFDDGIARFYVSEDKARPLERALADKDVKATLVISVSKDGRAVPVDLKINGTPWKEWAEKGERK